VAFAIRRRMEYNIRQFSLKWGRPGFDVMVEAVVARRGSLVGLVKNPGKKTKANDNLALAA
jgi:hypothetical protein